MKLRAISRIALTIVVVIIVLTATVGGYYAVSSRRAPSGTPSGSQSSSSSTGNSTVGGVLKVGISDEGLTTGSGLDPRLATAGGPLTEVVFRAVFESLIIETFNNTYAPWLATSWTVSSNGLNYTFILRQNVKFQDGTPFNASVVVSDFDYTLNTSVPGNFEASSFTSVENVQELNNYAVEFNLKTIDPFFLYNLASYGGFVSTSAIAKYGEMGIQSHPVGTGPFSFVSWTQGSQTVLTRFGGYWDGPVSLAGIVIQVVPDPSVQELELSKGQLNLILASAQQASDLSQPEWGVNEYIGPPSDMNILGFNLNASTGPAPLQNVLVREAINYAINRTALIDGVQDGFGVPAITLVPPSFPQWNASLRMYPPGGDVIKAKQLLEQAGYSNGFSVQLLASPYLGWDKIAVIIASQLAQVGINVQLNIVPTFSVEGYDLLTRTGAWSTGSGMAVYDSFIGSLYQLPYEFLSSNAVVFGFNLQSVNDSTLDGLLKNMTYFAAFANDSALLQKTVNAIQIRLQTQAYGAFLYYIDRVYVTTKNVIGFKPHPQQDYNYLLSAKVLGYDVSMNSSSLVESKFAGLTFSEPNLMIFRTSLISIFVSSVCFVVSEATEQFNTQVYSKKIQTES